MKIIYARSFVLMLLTAFILCACGNKHEAHYHGDTLQLDGEWYSHADSYLYKESNKKICKTEDGATLYEVEGDEERNYVVCRVLWEARLFVKDSYSPDRTIISGVCFGWSRDSYITDEKIIDCVLSLESNEEFIDDNEEMMESRSQRKHVYVKYGDEAVGESIGSIFQHNNQYMYYSYSKRKVTVLTDEQLDLLLEYL